MLPLDITHEKQILEQELNSIFSVLRRVTETALPTGIDAQLKIFQKLRADIYEDLNQLQHKALIIKAAELFQTEHPGIEEWRWHPKQTSHPDEPDLRGIENERIVISAEVTSSAKPIGTIDKRMANTLNSLNRKTGTLYYCVQSQEMLARANSKVSKNQFRIIVRLIP